MDTKQEPTFDEDLSTIVSQLPPPVRAFFSSGKVETVAKNLMQKNQLHIDQGAIVEREIILLLLGLKNPDEFSKALVEEAKLDQKTISSIVQDINEQIFVPLREQMRKGAEAAPQPQQPVKPAVPQASPQSAAATPPRPDWGSHASARVPSQPTTAIPTPPAPVDVKPPQVLVPAPPTSQRPALRDILATVMKAPTGKQVSPEPRQLLEDHEEPHIEFNKLPVAIPNLAVPAAPSTASVSPKPTTPKVPPPPAKPYSVDPYREPLDEK